MDTSDPAADSIVETEKTTYRITFTGGIERTSTFSIVDESGMEMPLETTVEEQAIQGELEQPLSNGEYTLKWQIVASDGHLQEGEIPFTVALPETTQELEETDKPEDTDVTETIPAEEPQVENEEVEYSSTPLLIAIGVAVVVIAGLLIFALRKK
ncbi:copper resistance CopC family protein [Mangrovibacillus cuniculi]|uniref:copper resistance CopC family protein n=1 Tax=Mangrovibacillus cuniculi TaxID=2593652 RepID=UPI0023BAC669|nr:copper resistance protein CopC [Mangrovibacillus cuniculi]